MKTLTEFLTEAMISNDEELALRNQIQKHGKIEYWNSGWQGTLDFRVGPTLTGTAFKKGKTVEIKYFDDKTKKSFSEKLKS